MTYMASCGDGGCANFDPINAEFFKIDEKGRDPTTGRWALANIAGDDHFDATDDVTLPTNLPKGEYLVSICLLSSISSNAIFRFATNFLPFIAPVNLVEPNSILPASKFA